MRVPMQVHTSPALRTNLISQYKITSTCPVVSMILPKKLLIRTMTSWMPRLAPYPEFTNSPVSSPSIYPHKSAKPPPDFDAARFRQWIQLSSSTNPRILVMSFNLLSQHYVWKQVFGYLDQEYLDWAHYRFPLINETISQFKCDIMCFQELEYLVYSNSWTHDFPLSGYALFYVKKPNPAYWGNKPSEYMDGVGIFVNTKRFDVLDHGEINFGQYVSENTDRFDMTNDLATRIVPRNTVAVMLKLKDKQTNKIVYVTNTHLYWLPKFNDVKVIQTKILLNALERFIHKDLASGEDPCVIMCGDYNSTPDLLVYRLLDTGKVDIHNSNEFRGFNYGKHLDGELLAGQPVTSPFRLSPAYGPLLCANYNDKLDFTSYTKSLTAVLDHIWYSSSSFEVSKVLGKVERTYCEGEPGFPNQQFPSDHIPLVSELVYV